MIDVLCERHLTVDPGRRAAYYRTAVSSQAFALLDDYVWKLAYKWATRRHRNKSKWWIADRYFGRFHPDRKDRWVLGDRDSGVYLHKFSWTRIIRHHDGHRRLGTRRSRPDRVLGQPASQAPTPAGQLLGLPGTAARTLPALRGLPPARRARSQLRRGVGAMGAGVLRPGGGSPKATAQPLAATPCPQLSGACGQGGKGT